MLQSSSNQFLHTRSEYARRLLYLKGEALNMEDYPMFEAIYDGDYYDMILKCARQVGKSVTLAAFGIIESICRPHFQTLFVTPSAEQTRRFSTLKVAKILQYSPFVRDHFMGDREANRVLLRMFRNGSELQFSYAEDDADRVRGLTSDRVCLDECQDMLLEAVEPVIVSCMDASKFKYLMRCGTPKTMENPIETAWQGSTMSEWIIPCKKCNKWNAIRSEEYFGPAGPICIKCKNLINPRDGRWLDFKPGRKRKGFHISRACMPETVPICWREGTPQHAAAVKGWGAVWEKLGGENPWPISKFRNEVIGVSDSVGRRIITLEQLRSMKTGPKIEPVLNPQGNCKGIGRLAAGIDWSGGGSENVSRTVLAIVGMTAERKLRLVYYKIFPGVNPVDEVNEIAATLNQFSSHLSMVGCDAGEGNMPTDMIRKKFNPSKVVKFRYCSSDYYIRWKQEGNYFSTNRTRAIDSLMMSLNRGEWEFPAEDKNIEVIFEDILNEFEEVTTQGNKVWRHATTRPDDGLHALNFARLAMQLAVGELDLTS